MGQYVVGSLWLLVTLHLAAALSMQGTSPITCEKEFLVLGKENCKCEGRQFGPGHTGDYKHDDRTESALYEMGKDIKSFWDFNAWQDNKQVPLQKFQSKLALVVNVASA